MFQFLLNEVDTVHHESCSFQPGRANWMMGTSWVMILKRLSHGAGGPNVIPNADKQRG